MGPAGIQGKAVSTSSKPHPVHLILTSSRTSAVTFTFPFLKESYLLCHPTYYLVVGGACMSCNRHLWEIWCCASSFPYINSPGRVGINYQCSLLYTGSPNGRDPVSKHTVRTAYSIFYLPNSPALGLSWELIIAEASNVLCLPCKDRSFAKRK